MTLVAPTIDRHQSDPSPALSKIELLDATFVSIGAARPPRGRRRTRPRESPRESSAGVPR
ncbi:hypothetical protein DB32_003438 [Sandaracinus amylolyticus]|uniref:Uncharacterized protein n=1 Tax=Sandaracinus amylolyticus TaxID=927083 RepID=A0A0F6SF42_9BACT|nr:hypothetical protein DB32_003438 [Sandaracinus amylolyticus]